MKLLEVTRAFYPSVGGMEKFVYERTKIYERLGIQYKILTTSFYSEKQDHTVAVDNIIRLKQFTPYNVVFGLASHFSDDYDYVSVNLLGRFYIDYTILHYAKRRQKILLTPYFAYHTTRLRFFKRILERALFPKLLVKVNALIVFSEYEKQYWMSEYCVPQSKLFVIPPYVACSNDTDEQNVQDVEEKYFLYVGRSGYNKKTDLLLKAFLSIDIDSVSLYLTIRAQDVEEDIRPLIVKNKRVRLLGYVSEEEKKRLIAGCEALVFPTSWESFGYVAFEAAALSKPILCSDLPVLRELHSKDGVIFFQNDVVSILNAMSAFLNYGKKKKQDMGIANRNHLSEFSFDITYIKYKKMFSAIERL